MHKAIVLFIAMLQPLFTAAQKPDTLRPQVTGISHVTLYADDLPASRRFYATLIGWEPVPAAGAPSGIRFYANHSQYVELVSPPEEGIKDRLDIVGFATDDADAMRRFLAAHGVAVPDAVTTGADGSKSFLTADPEGNKIEFTQQGSHHPPTPASPSESLSSHIVHAGYMVRDRAKLDHFYKDVLGFHLYWQGGAKPGDIDWVMMQVPNGTDWIEYMLYLPANPSRAELGSADHFSPGVESVQDLQQKLEQRGWKPPSQGNPQVIGVDGKLQLDLRDPDGTRVEFMEYKAVRKPCCSPVTGAQPGPYKTW
jgi:catechol 2,3-dioxygenase-like lactoylglutathione lyase family enzyme